MRDSRIHLIFKEGFNLRIHKLKQDLISLLVFEQLDNLCVADFAF